MGRFEPDRRKRLTQEARHPPLASSFVARAARAEEAAQLKDELSDREVMQKRFDELERKLDLLVSGQGVDR